MQKAKKDSILKDTPLFYPETIIITPPARASPITNEVLSRVQDKKFKPKIIYSDTQRPQFPPGFDSTDRYFYSKKAITLAERTDSFLETFASPGHIIEEPCTIVKTVFQCPNECEYCYLQRTAVRQPWQRIYINLQYLEREMINETVLHPAFLSVLSIISFHEKRVLDKIPAGFKLMADSLRLKLSRKGKANLTESLVLDYFKAHLKEILPPFGIAADGQQGYIDQFEEFYKINKSYPISFNISEYSDIVSSNHLHHQLEMFFDIVHRNENINIHFFTKSANMDSLLENFAGHGRIRIKLNLSTDYVQKKYEKGTSSLSERIRIAEKIQKSDGFRLVLHLEPIISYPGYEEDYLELMKTLMMRLDPKKIDGVTLGSVRYTGPLKGVIQKNYPKTDLFDESQELVKPEHKSDRYRYPLEKRVRIYSLLIEEIRRHSDVPVKFGAETPELWERLGLNSEEFQRGHFYQYKGSNDELTQQNSKRNNDLKENELDELKMLSRAVFSKGQSIRDAVEVFTLKYPEADRESIMSLVRDEFTSLAGEVFSKAEEDRISVTHHGGRSFYKYEGIYQSLYMDLETKAIYQNFGQVLESFGEVEPDKRKIINLLDLPKSPDDEDVIWGIVRFLKTFFRLKDESHYTFLAVYVLLSYVYRSFHTVPYIKLKGAKGTGKTTVLSVLHALMNNAEFASNLTPSALYRIMEGNGKTLLLDEAENLSVRRSSTESFFEILNSGYNSYGNVRRVIKGELKEFSTYGPKVIASINSLAPATEDRTIIVETDQNRRKTSPETFTKSKTDGVTPLKAKIFSKLPELLRRIPEELVDFDSREFGLNLKGRSKDRWMPILIITKILSGSRINHIKAIVEAAEQDISLKELEEKMSPEKIALEVLSDVVMDKETRRITSSTEYICVEAKTVSEAIITSDVQGYFMNQAHVTVFLKSRGVIVGRRRVNRELTILYSVPVSLIKQAKY